ncbi:MAG: anthranilate phosphoribosyltransferase [Opitutaceae bacterium]
MSLLDTLTPSLQEGHSLPQDSIDRVCRELASAEIDAATKAAFLIALAEKGETVAEIAGFASAFRSMARPSPLDSWSERAIDVCGTGGDRSGTFNISTVVAFVLAAAGVPVLKHGNRSITSKCGSADLLEALGVRIDADDDLLRAAMDELGFVFLFAPAFHPAFKEIGPVRKALAGQGRRSVFNILGPLINPARPAHQLLGVFSEGMVPVLAGALHQLGLKSGLVVHGRLDDGRGVDELTVATDNRVAGFGRLQAFTVFPEPGEVGVRASGVEALAGGDLSANLALLDRVLEGTAPPGLIDSILLNAATGLFIVKRVDSIEAGVAIARDELLGGGVRRLLDRTQSFYANR